MGQAHHWKRAGWGIALVAAVIASSALYVVRAAPEPDQIKSPAPVAAATPFARICKATALVDPRPQPAWVGASFANDNCTAPRLPAALDGYSASREQVVAAMAAAKRYAALSDAYQRCIADFAAGHAQADPPLRIIENHRILVAQENRKVAEQRAAAAIVAFNEYGSDCPDH